MEPLLAFAAFEKPNYPKSSVYLLMKFAFKEILSASIFEVSFDFMMCSSLVALVYAFFACVVAFISILRRGILGIFNQQGVLHMLLYLLKIIMLAYLDSSLAYIQVMDNGLYSGQPSILSFFLLFSWFVEADCWCRLLALLMWIEVRIKVMRLLLKMVFVMRCDFSKWYF